MVDFSTETRACRISERTESGAIKEGRNVLAARALWRVRGEGVTQPATVLALVMPRRRKDVDTP